MQRNTPFRKPYFWVNIPREQPHKDKPIFHESFEQMTGVLDFTLTVESEYLFVGSGHLEYNRKSTNYEYDLYYTFFRRGDKLCIPGTSLKGAIRSIVEAISNSCILDERKEDSPHSPCKYDDKTKILCPACRIFGVTGFRGRAYFSDATPLGELRPRVIKIAELWQPRLSNGRKFYFSGRFKQLDSRPQKNFRFIEVVSKGDCFRGKIFFENMSSEELGLLCMAMGLSQNDGERFYPKIGGGKPRCLGAVKFDIEAAQIYDANEQGFKSLLNLERIKSNELFNRINQWVLEGKKLIHTNSWQDFLRQIKQQRQCPEAVY